MHRGADGRLPKNRRPNASQGSPPVRIRCHALFLSLWAMESNSPDGFFAEAAEEFARPGELDMGRIIEIFANHGIELVLGNPA